jgi:hypothetical protein
MKEDFYFSNNSFEGNNDCENNYIFFMNKNQDFLPFHNNVNNFSNINDENLSFNQDKQDNNIFQLEDSLLEENNFNKDFSQISPIPPQNEKESSKQFINYNDNKSSNSNNNNSISTKDKSQIKNIQNNNSPQIEYDYLKNIEKKEIDNNNLKEDEKEEKKLITKKRKPRVHLEDLNIENIKFQKIGDKVILSRKQIITEDDKKEIRAIRNRISAQKSRDRKKVEFANLKEKIKSLNDELERKNKLIQKYEQICCSQCKMKMMQFKNQLFEDNNMNNNKFSEENENEEKDEGLILEENNSLISNLKNPLTGKISGILIGFLCLIGISICIFGGNLNFKSSINLSDSSERTFRNLNEANICVNQDLNDKNNYIIDDNNNNNNNNMPIPIQSLNNNFLQMCHDKFTLDINSNYKKKSGKKGNLLKKNYNKDSIIDNQVCIDSKNIMSNNYIINNSNFMNNLPIESNNIILNGKLSNKIISVFVKDYKTLKRYKNGRCLSLQEQIETESKNSEDGCVYLQVIIPKEEIKSDFENNNTTYPDSVKDYFEIRCKIFAINNFYDISH